MIFNVLTIFPDLIFHYSNESILRRAQEKELIRIRAIDLREFTGDPHKKIDDTPYGGGAGMVMKPEPIFAALRSIDAIPFHKADGLLKVKKIFSGHLKRKRKTILLSPRGRQFDQRQAIQWKGFDEITMVCGRYEGVDQRVADHMVDDEISVGPYVLAGGELPALVIIEAVSRLIPGVLGNEESLEEETFSYQRQEAKTKRVSTEEHGHVHTYREYPHYTKPAHFRGWKVPDVLLSGDHAQIKHWREQHVTEE